MESTNFSVTRLAITIKILVTTKVPSRRLTSTSSLPAVSHSRSKKDRFRRSACQVTPMTTRWIASVPKYLLVKTLTQSSLQVNQARVLNSRLSTTSSSRRSNSISKWCLSRVKTASRCSTLEHPEASLTLCSRIITRPWMHLSNNRKGNSSKPPNRSTHSITTNTSTVFQVTQFTRHRTFLSSRIDQLSVKKRDPNLIKKRLFSYFSYTTCA